MTTYTYLGGTNDWTNPLAWDVGAVPLYDYGSTVNIGLGSVTLHDIAPDNMTASLQNGSDVTLSNAAVGAGLDVRTGGAPASVLFGNDTALVRVAGYDTNYGTIETSHGPADTGSYRLLLFMQSYAQLNNEGTITAYSQAMPGTSQLATAVLEVSSNDSTGTLNNDGQINVTDDAQATISTAVIGTGRMTVASPDTQPDGSPYRPSLSLNGPVAATQTVELDAGTLFLGGSASNPDLFAGTIAGWTANASLFLGGGFEGTSLDYTQTSADGGVLSVSGKAANGGPDSERFNLHLAGTHAASDFALGPQVQVIPGPTGSQTVTVGTFVTLNA